MSSADRLTGQRVLIVGGTSGMGLGAARSARAAGAEVIVAGRRPIGGRDGPKNVQHEVLDYRDESAVRALFERLGKLDHLFVSATPPTASTRSFMEEKFFGSWACAHYAAPNMRAGGSITFLTGCISVRPRAGLALVTATFAALEAFGQALALELAPIRVNTIRPGVVDSPMWSFLDDAEREKLFRSFASTLPARRVGAIDDIGDAAVFLMSNPYVTGTVLEISGGETLVKLDI